jgi:hypothetical protein
MRHLDHGAGGTRASTQSHLTSPCITLHHLASPYTITLHHRYPCIDLAYAAGRQGGTMTGVLNAANEMANEVRHHADIMRLVLASEDGLVCASARIGRIGRVGRIGLYPKRPPSAACSENATVLILTHLDVIWTSSFLDAARA